MEKVTLGKVFKRSTRSVDFFNKLVRNPESTLKRAGWTLSPKDTHKLNRLLRKSSRISFAQLFRLWAGFTTPRWGSIINEPVSWDWWARRKPSGGSKSRKKR